MNGERRRWHHEGLPIAGANPPASHERNWECHPIAEHAESGALRAALERLPRLRLTGEQLDRLGHGLTEPEFAVDWDEYDEFVRLDDVRALSATQDETPGLDEERLASRLIEAQRRNHGPLAISDPAEARALATWLLTGNEEEAAAEYARLSTSEPRREDSNG